MICAYCEAKIPDTAYVPGLGMTPAPACTLCGRPTMLIPYPDIKGKRIVGGDYTIELEDIGEGRSGDWDPDDPEDEPLLRFSVTQASSEDYFEQVDDGSYCTNLNAEMIEQDPDLLRRALVILYDALYEKIGKDGFKRTAEKMSWIGADWLEPERYPLSELAG